MRVDYTPPATASLREWPAWVRMVENLLPTLEELNTPSIWYHGVEHAKLFNRSLNLLADRQWFSIRRDIAETYAELPGYCLELITTKPIKLVRISQSNIVRSHLTNRFIKELREKIVCRLASPTTM